MTPEVFFTRSGDWFVGTDAARGPWSEEACHAGPVAGLVARAVEALVPGKQLARLTIDLARAAPMSGFRVEADLQREGRLLANATARIVDRDGRVCASAASVHIAARDLQDVPTHLPPSPEFAGSIAGHFPASQQAPRKPTFADAVEVRIPAGSHPGTGPATVWMKTPALLGGETPTPFQRICPLADCGNGLSRNSDIRAFTFINVDLTISLYRAPVSEWLGSSSVSHWQPTGIGLAEARLFDTRGAIGSAVQTLIISQP